MLITMATYALSTGYSLVFEDRTSALSLCSRSPSDVGIAYSHRASALSPNIWVLGLCRFCASLGIGGEWAAGAALVVRPPPLPNSCILFFSSSFTWFTEADNLLIVSSLYPC